MPYRLLRRWCAGRMRRQQQASAPPLPWSCFLLLVAGSALQGRLDPFGSGRWLLGVRAVGSGIVFACLDFEVVPLARAHAPRGLDKGIDRPAVANHLACLFANPGTDTGPRRSQAGAGGAVDERSDD